MTTADILALASVAAGWEDGGEGDDNDNNEDFHGGGGRGCIGGRGGGRGSGRALAAAAFVVTKLDRRPGGRTDHATHRRQ